MSHLACGDVLLLVDTEEPDIIHGFAAMTGATVHYAMMKRRLREVVPAREVFATLLGARLHCSCMYTSELNGLYEVVDKLGKREVISLVPRFWTLDGGWYFREREAR